MTHVLVLVGSLRAGSTNQQIAEAAVRHAPDGVTLDIHAGLDRLPFYNEDVDVAGSVPAEAVAFRDAIAAADALLVITPEYNGTMPAVLKNAIDWASRPRGSAAIAGKPVAVVSVSPSPRGAQWAREDAVRILRVAGAEPLEDSVGVATVHAAIVDGFFADYRVEQALTELMHSLVAAASAQYAPAA